MRRNALGKGLSALLPEPEQPPPPAAEAPQEVPLDALEPNPDQPRSAIAEERLAELAASLRESGMVQPILVRRRGTASRSSPASAAGGRLDRSASPRFRSRSGTCPTTGSSSWPSSRTSSARSSPRSRRRRRTSGSSRSCA